MAQNGTTPNLDTLNLSDTIDTDDLFASPSRSPKKSHKSKPSEVANPEPQSAPDHDTEEARLEAHEASLRRELASIRNINQVIEGVVTSLERAKGNMDAVSQTVTSATSLLNTYTRILSQTEHNNRLILSPQWHGASDDLSKVENESILRQQAKERREIEEKERREVAARKAEEEERRREAAASVKRTRGGRGRSSGYASAGRGRSIGYVGVGGQGGRGVGRGGAAGQGTGAARGSSTGRGRGRGVS